MKTMGNMISISAIALSVLPMTAAFAEDAEALAKKLAKPIDFFWEGKYFAHMQY